MNAFYKFLTNVETVVIDHVRNLGVLPGDPNEWFNSNLKMSDKYDPKFRIKVDTKSLFFGPQCENMTPLELEEGMSRVGRAHSSKYFSKSEKGQRQGFARRAAPERCLLTLPPTRSSQDSSRAKCSLASWS